MSMIIDFASKVQERDSKLRYDVGVISFRDNNFSAERIGNIINPANNSMLDLPTEEYSATYRDELIFDKGRLEHFRHVLLTITERLAKDDPSAWSAPNVYASKENEFLRPIFNKVLQKGVTMWTVLREMQRVEFPIPEKFLVFLPPAAAKNPDRDDIIRALVPFKKAQREALQAGWDSTTVALQISYTPPQRALI